MRDKLNTIAISDQTHVCDFLREALRSGRRVSKDTLLALDHHEPLADLTNGELQSALMTPAEHAEWWKWAREMRRKFPGFQASPTKLKKLKYDRNAYPRPGAPLAEFVALVLGFARSAWSGAIMGDGLKLQLVDFLPDYLKIDHGFWAHEPDVIDALRLLRRAYDLPDFPPTTARDQRRDRFWRH